MEGSMGNEPEKNLKTASKLRSRKDAAARIREVWGYKITAQTLAKYACLGGGPRYRKISSQVVYSDDDCDAWVTSRISPLRTSTSDVTSNDAASDQAAAA